MRIVATSTYSKSVLNTINDEFTLTLSDTCGGNELALDAISYPNVNGGSAVSNFVYHIDDAAVSKKPVFSAKVALASCPISSKLYIFKATDNTWLDQTVPDGTYPWIQSFDAASGTLVVYQSGAFQTSATYTVRITFTDPLALNPALTTV
jgi:hypothetical protein